MKPVDSQITAHDPDNGQIGDCFRACMASLLEMDWRDVPHFYDYPVEDGGERGVEATLEWLAGHGLSYVEFPFLYGHKYTVEQALNWMGSYAGDNHYLMLATSQLGFTHVVVCLGDKVVHDPTYGDPHGLVGPVGGGWYWAGLLVPK